MGSNRAAARTGDVTGDTNRASGDSGTGRYAEPRDKSSGLNIGHSCWTARFGTWVPMKHFGATLLQAEFPYSLWDLLVRRIGCAIAASLP
jgi:hypothetical protein